METQTKTKQVNRNGVIYYEGQKCPACSGERDKGGRMETVKPKQVSLRCTLCKYTVKPNEITNPLT